MAVINSIAGFADDMKIWRRWLHQHPELQFDCHETAAYVAQKLEEFGVDEVHTGIATSGVVAVINGTGEGPVIGLRADMDALPIAEATGVEYASLNPGKMHACGHDGHTTMLLGAARYLAETRGFSGKVVLIFQPAEEDGGGADVMVREGVLDRFGVDEVYALHNVPGADLGTLAGRVGPLLAGFDTFEIYVTGSGGHAATPHETNDPIVAAVAMVQTLQTIVSRNHNSGEDLVVSVTQIHAGTADNIVPGEAYICGTVRSFDAHVKAMAVGRIEAIVAGTAAAFGLKARLDYQHGYPPTVNHEAQTVAALDVARDMMGADMVDGDAERTMGAEDFAYMLAERPGSYLFLGQGPGVGLHHPEYDFNDEVAPIGASYFARLVETLAPAKR